MYPAWAGQASERRGGLVYIRHGGQNKQDPSTVGFVACCIVKMIQLEMQWTHGDCVFLALRKMAQDVLQKKNLLCRANLEIPCGHQYFGSHKPAKTATGNKLFSFPCFPGVCYIPTAKKMTQDWNITHTTSNDSGIPSFPLSHLRIVTFSGYLQKIPKRNSPRKRRGWFTSNSWYVSCYIGACGLTGAWWEYSTSHQCPLHVFNSGFNSARKAKYSICSLWYIQRVYRLYRDLTVIVPCWQ